MKVSIIIPTYNEEKYIANCISSLMGQTYKNKEIIIVDDGSTDKTIEVIKCFDVKLLEQSHKGTGVARNYGVSESTGEILIFVDADMIFDKNYLNELIKPIINGEVVGTSHGTEIIANNNNNIARMWGRRIKNENIKIFRAILKNKFLEVCGFNNKLGYADDQTINLKLGICPKIIHKAICYHYNLSSLSEVYKQSVWIGESFISFNLTKYIGKIIGILKSIIYSKKIK